MEIATLRLLFDSGLLVLIWMVQLIVYPGFAYYSFSDLRKWHAVYTKRISYVVIPLMVGQLVLAVLEAFTAPNASAIVGLALVLLVWVFTFGVFVPLHHTISEEPPQRSYCVP